MSVQGLARYASVFIATESLITMMADFGAKQNLELSPPISKILANNSIHGYSYSYFRIIKSFVPFSVHTYHGRSFCIMGLDEPFTFYYRTIMC